MSFDLRLVRHLRFLAFVMASWMWSNSGGMHAADRVSRIKSDERVVFFPKWATLSEDRQFWVVPIHGWVFEPEQDDALRGFAVRKLRDALGVKPDAPATRAFDARIRLFLVDNERGKRIGIRIAGEQPVLGKSGANGHFTGIVRLPVAKVEPRLTNGVLRFKAITSDGDHRVFEGSSFCVSTEGISVISDIDDTIKITEALDRKEMISNTFFREFRAAPGMATTYAKWAGTGAQFHYVSASPWQLYEPLAAFMSKTGFPAGTFSLRQFRLKDSSFLRLFGDPIKYKLSVIEPLLQAFPRRRFILVGDSGEKDPEVYGTVARRFPSQVSAIYIRDVSGDPPHGPRYQQAFAGIPADKWQVFKEPKELPAIGKN